MPLVFADVVDRADVRVVQRRDRARLAFKPPQPMGIGRERCRENLDRHVPAEPRVLREVHLAHSARTEQRDDFVRTQSAAGCQSHGVAWLFYWRPGLRPGGEPEGSLDNYSPGSRWPMTIWLS